METLSELYKPLSHLCDKGTVHSYIDPYESLLRPFRERAVTVIEIGIDSGASLALWTRFFHHPRAVIIGVDVVDKRTVLSSATVVLGDASTELVAAPLPPCDIVIDDGSHELADQGRSFGLLWPKVRAGGLYVIEDVQGDRELRMLRIWHPQLEPVDLRTNNGRYDDVLLVGRKQAGADGFGRTDGKT